MVATRRCQSLPSPIRSAIRCSSGGMGLKAKVRSKKSKTGSSKKASRVARAAAPKSKSHAKAKAADPLRGVAELALQRELNRFADELLEACHHERLSIRATLNRFLPAISQK